MERIRLTGDEKKVMLMLHHNKNGGFTQIEQLAFAHTVRSLEQKGLVRGFWSEESGLVHAVLTGVGETYIYFNPRLKNPVDWKWIISLVVASIAAISSVLVLFACMK